MEFSIERYWLLPFDYIINGVNNVLKLRQRELHENERPISLMMSYQAEMNRDKKKRKKPFTIDEFYLYGNMEDIDRIDPVYGAAASALIEQRMYPSWALFIYKELMERASEVKAPELLCYLHHDAIILAPVIEESVCRGMLIAKEAASGQSLEMISPCGQKIKVRMPDIRNKFIAEENCYLDCYR